MIHPEKWRETENPFQLPFRRFTLKEVLGYPHAGNDVFQVIGIHEGREVEAYIKVARRLDADIENEINTIEKLKCDLAPQILDFDEARKRFVVTLAMPGDRLSVIAGENKDRTSMKYMYEYGRALALLHGKEGDFPAGRDRRFFHVPEQDYLKEQGLEFIWDYLVTNRPEKVNRCFCHGDFHYANILWENGHMSAVLDFELSGIGNREFDIAWATIRRPGQQFMNSTEELDLFRAGYDSVGTADWDYVKYYMVQIYSYFYTAGSDLPEYQDYVVEFLRKQCRNT